MSVLHRARKVTLAMQRRIVPTLRYSQDHFEGYLAARAATARSWLDIGCGHQMLSAWRLEREKVLLRDVPLIIGIDFDFASLLKHRTIHNLARADARKLPFADNTFDFVTANMVVEHLDEPLTQFTEIGRTLRPGGRFVFHTPNTHSYLVAGSRILPDSTKKALARILEGRDEGDVFPTHYRANSIEDIARIAATAGFEIEDVSIVSSVPLLAIAPPLVLFELLFLRVLEMPTMEQFRSNIMCTLRKRGTGVPRTESLDP